MLSPQQKDEKRMREEKVEGEKGNEKREKVREGEAFWDALEEQEVFYSFFINLIFFFLTTIFLFLLKKGI